MPVSTQVPSDRVLIVGLYPTDTDAAERCLDELASLVRAADGEVVARVVQRRGLATDDGPRDRPIDPATHIGRGKVEEVARLVQEHDVQVVAFDNELSPAQIRELTKRIGCRVIDRSELILDIFASRARTRGARLQVELAQLQYTAPRLRGMWTHLERQAGKAGGTGGMGTRGPGEQQIEIDRRIVQRRVTQLRAELDALAARRERQVTARAGRAWSAGLVGYTNAGKSTLLNALTGAEAYAADKLFATLDTVSRRWELQPGVAIPLSDTVGFVRDLPHHLVAGFRSTLAEALHADLLLHVVDASHPDAVAQVEVVHQVLSDLGVPSDRVLGVLNKADALEDRGVLVELRGLLPDAVEVSALTGQGLDVLGRRVADRRSAAWVRVKLSVPHDRARVVSQVHEHGEVLDARWDDQGWFAVANVPVSLLPALEGCTIG